MFANFLYSFTIWKLVVLGSIYNFKDFLKFNIFYNIIYVFQLYIKLVFFNCSVLIIIKNCNLKYFNSFYAHQLNYRVFQSMYRQKRSQHVTGRDWDTEIETEIEAAVCVDCINASRDACGMHLTIVVQFFLLPLQPLQPLFRLHLHLDRCVTPLTPYPLSPRPISLCVSS